MFIDLLTNETENNQKIRRKNSKVAGKNKMYIFSFFPFQNSSENATSALEALKSQRHTEFRFLETVQKTRQVHSMHSKVNVTLSLLSHNT